VVIIVNNFLGGKMMKRNGLENKTKSKYLYLFITFVINKPMIKSIVSIILLLLTIPQTQYAQAPEIEWVNLYGEHAQARGIQVTPDSGYIACGFIGQVADEDYYLVRVNSYGDTLWTRRYDFFDGGNEALYSVDLASDGGYVATGYGDWNGTSLKCFILKVNSVGDTVWSRTYNTISQGNSISCTSDSGYIIAGKGWDSGSQMVLHKIDSVGDVMWTENYGPYWAWDAQQTTDGGYIATGSTGGGAGPSDISLVKTDSVGDTIWTRTFSRGRRGLSVRQTFDGGYIISGYGYVGSALRPCLIKTNADGDTLWTKLYTTPESYCTGSHVRQTPDGGYILAESGTIDILRRTDSEGNTIWTLSLPSYGYNHIHSLQITPENGYIVAGYDWPSGSTTQLYIAKTEPDPTLVGIENNYSSIPLHYSLSQNYPNPFNPSGAGRSPSTTISFFVTQNAMSGSDGSSFVTLDIYNIKGQKVKQLLSNSAGQQSAGQHSVIWDGKDDNNKPVASGIYLYRFAVGNFSETKKCLILK
jgi:hypothetical protein